MFTTEARLLVPNPNTPASVHPKKRYNRKTLQEYCPVRHSFCVFDGWSYYGKLIPPIPVPFCDPTLDLLYRRAQGEAWVALPQNESPVKARSHCQIRS